MPNRTPLSYYVCPRTADCYVVMNDERGRWTYKGQPVSLSSANYHPPSGLLEFRWDVSPLNVGFDSYEKARGAIATLGLTVANR